MLPTDPKQIPGLYKQAVAHISAGRLSEARTILQQIRIVNPRIAEVHFQLGRIAVQERDFDRAVQCFDQAAKLKPGEKAIRQQLADAQVGAGSVLLNEGRFVEAEALYKKALKSAPEAGRYYLMYTTARKMAGSDPLIPVMERLWDKPGLPDPDRWQLGFALAKTMDDIGAHERTFGYLRVANDLVRTHHPYDVRQRRVTMEAMTAAFSDVDFTTRQVAGARPFAPIFVSGMPRSGTTLVEQIISGHSRVTSGGELPFMPGYATKLTQDPTGAAMFRPLHEIPDKEIAALGQLYEMQVKRQFPDVDIICDKAIPTYVMMGVAKLALPNAKFVVVRRDPRDNLLSIYKNLFPEGKHLYAYDLGDLGHYYRYFIQQVEYWREKLPGAFYEIQYEDLIANPEQEARKLIAACGLGWEDGCLDFYKNKGPVETLSVYQVRQPIYSSSVKAWKRHEGELGDMFAALEATD